MKQSIPHLWLNALLLVALAVSQRSSTVLAGSVPVTPVSYVWRSGVQVNQPSPPYVSVTGRARSAAAQFTSSSADSYFLMEAPANPVIVRHALVRILTRTGSYTGHATLDLEIHNMNSMLRKTVTATSLDLQTAPDTAWLILNLESLPDNRIIQINDMLVFHLILSDAPGENFSATILFEVAVSNLIHSNYAPLISR